MKKNNNNCLNNNWSLTETEPNAFDTPETLKLSNSDWIQANVPGTVAQALSDKGGWSFDNHLDFDSKDWWYKTNFRYSNETSVPFLTFGGLATLCEVYLNGKLILSTENMFIAYTVDVSGIIQGENELFLCFRSLTTHLSKRRARPKWKTKLVDTQQIRWVRTTLLGRIPGWTPPVASVGPWKSISLLEKNKPEDIQLFSSINGDKGLIDFSCQIYCTDESEIKASLKVSQLSSELKATKTENGYQLKGQFEINNVKRWWPNTHGDVNLYMPELLISINQHEAKYTLPGIGFKDIIIDQSNNNFSIKVNGQDIFCRGACWTVNDIITLLGNTNELKNTLTLMRDAGTNLIRVGGTMIYEQEKFYQLCDELGIMVWQDFMFANMDYPISDPEFLSSVKNEVKQTITRLRQHPCISIYCGNSEVEQQAAMLGLAPEKREEQLFGQIIPEYCKHLHPSIPYVASTPSGNILPFHTNKNLTHYYGIGAYQRPLSELRQHDVRFTPECLGFSNIPIKKTRNKILNGHLPVSHHPRWKERTPRDTGTGWDFEDTRDHYTNALYDIDVTKLRCFDSERYMEISEVSTGEIMSSTFSEWRSPHSNCSGGLIWFLKDFWPGAGWGVIDSNGFPKACYYFLKRTWQPINIVLTNETLNGIDIHVVNESPNTFNGQLELSLHNEDSVCIANDSVDIKIPKQSSLTINSDEILKSFYDVTYSYRFGASKHTIVAAKLKSNINDSISEAFYFPNAKIPDTSPNSKLNISTNKIDDDNYALELSCNHFLYAVTIEIDGYIAADNFFNLLPNSSKHIHIKKMHKDANRFKGYVSALNLKDEVKIKV